MNDFLLELIKLIIAVIFGGGFVALLRYRQDTRKVVAETEHEGASTAHEISEAWAKFIEPLNGRLNDQAKTIEQQAKTIERLGEKVDKLEQALINEREINASLRSENKDQKARIEALQAQVAAKNAEIEKKDAELAARNAIIDSLRCKYEGGTNAKPA